MFDGIAGLVEDGHAPLRAQTSAPRVDQVAGNDDDEPLPAFMAEPRAPRRAMWAGLAALSLLTLFAQAAYYFRAELAASIPAARVPLQAACAYLNCEVRLPRMVKLLSIDSYEVRADPRRDGVIVLNAVIRNRAPFPQEYPALQLTLTDEANRQLVSRAISPPEYLGASRAPQLIDRGLDPGAETSLTVYFDASRTRATGYELVLFYPS
ncbi:MAG TPA: DUF3426 domain-containing protein [Burkholderiales bacterium]|nr:DUF3426 domain-containing protein [Burkholderiales bacterium]